MISFIGLVTILVRIHCCFCRTSIEEATTTDISAEEKTNLQVEKYEKELYNVIFTFNNETFDFNITKKEFDVDVYIADDEGNTNITDYEDVDLYQNRDWISSLVIFKDDVTEEFHLNGIISENIVLKSSSSSRSKREIEEDSMSLCPNCLNLADHYVVKNAVKYLKEDAVGAEYDDDVTDEKTSNRQSRRLPDTVYPELLVYVDYDFYKNMRSHAKIKRYIVSYVNAVNLRFEQFHAPNIVLGIAGIVIGQSRSSFPFVSKNIVRRTYLDAPSSLHSMGEHFFVQRSNLPVYDMVIGITGLDMTRRMNGGKTWNYATAGYSYIGGACTRNSFLKKISSVALIEDSGAYSGVIVTAHEIGHLLGASHDGDVAPRYLRGPGAQKCPWKDGYIMSDMRRTSKGLHWSKCSLESVKHFLKSSRASCLNNKPKKSEYRLRGSKILGENPISLDAQCRADKGTKACYHDHRVCAQLFCFQPNSRQCYAYRPAVEGSHCGKGKRCSDGKCIRT